MKVVDLFAVVIDSKKPAIVHSIHNSTVVANQWAHCKVHDGESVEVILIPKEVVQEILEMYPGDA